MCIHVNAKTQFKHGRNHMIVVVVDDDGVLYTPSRPRCHYNRLISSSGSEAQQKPRRERERDGNAVIERRKDRANENRKREDERTRGKEKRGLTGGPREKRLRLVVAASVEMY